ncbi:MAG TPA: type I 3-dehydroquinate dehydratase [Ktedonobacterales bacterium]|nr:type I 3-dehydroquinate dehydratase [Ktedonobacterales bacterium]
MNKIAAALALPDTQACLATLHTLASAISMAEVRLDLMETFDLPRLIAEAPCPLIITCRPPREGGRFTGSEAERLDILAQAMDVGCAYVDCEWDSISVLAERRRSATQIIASRHWTDSTPADVWPTYEALRGQADVVKLVGLAARPIDTLPIFHFLRRATSPVIGMAMGQAGQLTRLLAPCFPQSLLTYAAPSAAAITAPGQLSVREMTETYHVDLLGPHTAVHLHFCATDASAQAVLEQNRRDGSGEAIGLPLLVAHEEAAPLAEGLRACLPRLIITADPALAEKL